MVVRKEGALPLETWLVYTHVAMSSCIYTCNIMLTSCTKHKYYIILYFVYIVTLEIKGSATTIHLLLYSRYMHVTVHAAQK